VANETQILELRSKGAPVDYVDPYNKSSTFSTWQPSEYVRCFPSTVHMHLGSAHMWLLCHFLPLGWLLS
jgi:hypothetical protein